MTTPIPEFLISPRVGGEHHLMAGARSSIGIGNTFAQSARPLPRLRIKSINDKRKNVSASKPATPIKPASGISVDTRIPRNVKWSSVTENRELVAKHRPPKVRKLPSGQVIKR